MFCRGSVGYFLFRLTIVQPLNEKNRTYQKYGFYTGVANGARTHDNRNHNPGLYQLSYSHHKTGTPDRNRTRNPRLRRSVLYPVELRARISGVMNCASSVVGAVGFELTTLCSQSRCANRAALRPDVLKDLNYRDCLDFGQDLYKRKYLVI